MKKLLLISFLFISAAATAQNVGIGTANPEESAILDLNSTKKGFLLPRLTEKQKTLIPQPAEGLMIYQTDNTQGVYLYQGGAWKNMGSSKVTTSTVPGINANITTPNYLLSADANGNPVASSIFLKPSNGFIGIGTNSPISKLHISDGISGNTLPLNAQLTFESSSNGGLVISVPSSNSAGIIFPKGTDPYYAFIDRYINDLRFGNNNEEKMRLISNGNFLIGSTSDNGSKLQVNGTGSFTKFKVSEGNSQNTLPSNALGLFESNVNAGIAISAPVNNSAGIFFPKGTDPYFTFIDRYINDLRFGNNNEEKMRLVSNGNFLIGSTSDNGSKLQVNGTGSFTKFKVSEGNSQNILPSNALGLFESNMNAGIAISAPINNSAGIFFPKGTDPYFAYIDRYLNDLRFGNGNEERLRITSDGKVGIGIISPTEKLDVNGSIKQTSVISNLLRSDANGKLVSSIAISEANNSTTSNSVKIDSKSAGYLAVGDFGAGTPMSIPAGYRLVVQDGIITEKVKVAVRNQTDWADYVFEPTYSLMPLNDVEKFVKENKHLPNVPSAEEMVEKGVEVGQTSKMFMEKIEELTLYMIELKKEIEKLKSENARLKK